MWAERLRVRIPDEASWLALSVQRELARVCLEPRSRVCERCTLALEMRKSCLVICEVHVRQLIRMHWWEIRELSEKIWVPTPSPPAWHLRENWLDRRMSDWENELIRVNPQHVIDAKLPGSGRRLRVNEVLGPIHHIVQPAGACRGTSVEDSESASQCLLQLIQLICQSGIRILHAEEEGVHPDRQVEVHPVQEAWRVLLHASNGNLGSWWGLRTPRQVEYLLKREARHPWSFPSRGHLAPASTS
mmetsp:Transcript_25753/g.60131  ORF Transcript_25753/g.60131 Transcript_25753/m.60131 type:complete len:245 (-) Transcript_25753:33-767(-)